MALIYLVINKVNSKVYIGQTTLALKERRKIHERESKAKKWQIHKALQKHGFENFHWSTLEECSEKILDEREIFYIKKFNSFKEGYNATEGGGGFRGRKFSKQERYLRSEKMKGNSFASGYKHSDEAKKKIGMAVLGRKLSDETKEKMRKAALGRKLSDETKEKIRQFCKQKDVPKALTDNFFKKGNVPWNKGRKHSEETKQKMRKPKRKKDELDAEE